ncbi:MAG: DUF433 domain-containing protein [Pirellulales bacterium]
MSNAEFLGRITHDAAIFGGKAIIRGRRLAVEHVTQMLAAGSSEEDILAGFAWLDADDIRACVLYNKQNSDTKGNL